MGLGRIEIACRAALCCSTFASPSRETLIDSLVSLLLIQRAHTQSFTRPTFNLGYATTSQRTSHVVIIIHLIVDIIHFPDDDGRRLNKITSRNATRNSFFASPSSYWLKRKEINSDASHRPWTRSPFARLGLSSTNSLTDDRTIFFCFVTCKFEQK